MTTLLRPPCDEGVIRGAPGVPGCAHRDKPWVLAATILGSSMAFIDGSVVSVALPAMQADFAGSVQAVQWIVNSYTLMLGALILVGGSAGDRFGRRRVFVIGIVIFTAASVACGLAADATMLIIARAAQGVGGALLIPSSLAIISASFPDDERGRAIGTWAGFSALTTALGPVLGGWLVDALSWRVIFLINVPMALVTLAIALSRVPESRDPSDGAGLDWQGAILVTLGLGAVTYGLTAVSDHGWAHAAVLVPLIVGTAALIGFVWVERYVTPAPMVPLDLFRSATFSGANMMTLLLYFALSGAFFFLPFNLIQIQGYSATLAGAAFLPFTLIMGALSRLSGTLVDRFGARLPLIVGPIIASVGIALMALPGIGGSFWITFFLPMTVLGLGMAVSVAPLTTAVMGAVDEHHAGAASGINNAVSRISGLIAVALLGAVAVKVFGMTLDARMIALNVPPDVRLVMHEQVASLAESQVPATLPPDRQQALTALVQESFVLSFRIVMLICAGAALVGALCAALTIRAPERRRAR
ncbi:MAG: DHA2 family efflux MFS transporter permease subunit [Rhizobiales bacterium]|nr:DHA2 family efflux MFS transporter permease subunit [Hyphomicrobiales bacterium]